MPIERYAPAPVLERGRRCENCTNFNNGPLAIQHYKAKRMADLQRHAADIFERGAPALPVGVTGKRLGDDDPHSPKIGGSRTQREGDFSDLDAHMQALGLNYEYGDKLMREKLLGICMVGAAPGDFVHKDYLCGDQGPCRYVARVIVEDAHKHDETAGEARERLGLKDDDK